MPDWRDLVTNARREDMISRQNERAQGQSNFSTILNQSMKMGAESRGAKAALAKEERGYAQQSSIADKTEANALAREQRGYDEASNRADDEYRRTIATEDRADTRLIEKEIREYDRILSTEERTEQSNIRKERRLSKTQVSKEIRDWGRLLTTRQLDENKEILKEGRLDKRAIQAEYRDYGRLLAAEERKDIREIKAAIQKNTWDMKKEKTGAIEDKNLATHKEALLRGRPSTDLEESQIGLNKAKIISEGKGAKPTYKQTKSEAAVLSSLTSGSKHEKGFFGTSTDQIESFKDATQWIQASGLDPADYFIGQQQDQDGRMMVMLSNGTKKYADTWEDVNV